MRNTNRRSEAMRNRILLLLLAAVAALAVVIIVTNPEKEPAVPANVSSVDDSQPETSLSVPEDDGGESESKLADESSSSSTGASASASTSTSASASTSTSASASSGSAAGADVPEEPKSGDLYYEAALPLLVNPTNKIPEGYTPDVEVIGGGSNYSYDRKAVVGYRAMAAAAQADGITLSPVSAYRNHERQVNNFNNKQKEYEGMGYSAEQAYAATAQLIAIPGTSEHELGLALDLNSLETSFENTKTYTWLIKNCAQYGFILRYPKDKTEITDISFEPWHYRYVGSNHAKIIMEKGICLEEYLSGEY